MVLCIRGGHVYKFLAEGWYLDSSPNHHSTHTHHYMIKGTKYMQQHYMIKGTKYVYATTLHDQRNRIYYAKTNERTTSHHRVVYSLQFIIWLFPFRFGRVDTWSWLAVETSIKYSSDNRLIKKNISDNARKIGHNICFFTSCFTILCSLALGGSSSCPKKYAEQTIKYLCFCVQLANHKRHADLNGRSIEVIEV